MVIVMDAPMKLIEKSWNSQDAPSPRAHIIRAPSNTGDARATSREEEDRCEPDSQPR